MPRLALVPRVSSSVASLLLFAGCQGHTPRPADGPGGPPPAESRGVFDPAGIGPGAPPQPGPPRPLDAIDYGPIGRTEGGGQIHVRFNQQVVPLDLRSESDYSSLFSFDPPLPGKAFFKTPDLLVFEPEEALLDCHMYTARFAGGLVGMNGQRFDKPLTWTFETVRPTVSAVHPEAGTLDRRRDSVVEERPLIATSREAYEVMRPWVADLPHEEFWLLLLDRGNRLLDRVKVSQGGIHGTVADPKVIFREALEKRASSVLLCHNHPSGQLRPSSEDITLTNKLVEGGRYLDIVVQDHLIVGSTGYFSFADNGHL